MISLFAFTNLQSSTKISHLEFLKGNKIVGHLKDIFTNQVNIILFIITLIEKKGHVVLLEWTYTRNIFNYSFLGS